MKTLDRNTINLKRLNSLTKYPSIPTYHNLDPRNGCLIEGNPILFLDDVIATEKVDGTNSRIIFLPDGTYMIGSREDLLYAQGDLIGNPALGIVEHLRDGAERIAAGGDAPDIIVVAYLELYGGKIGSSAKQYTTDPSACGWRLFDVALVEDWEDKLAWSPNRIAAWRDGGGQWFADEETLAETARRTGMVLTPRMVEPFHGDTIPATIEGMHAMLQDLLPRTQVALDDAAGGRPEGVVFRSPDRSAIAKARFQDYERTLKLRADGR